jgi:hypothetical protein
MKNAFEPSTTSTNLKNRKIISEPTISSKTLENTNTNSESMPTTAFLSNKINNRENFSDNLLFYIFLGIFGVLLIILCLAFLTHTYRRKQGYSLLHF